MVLEGHDAVKAARQVIGATNPLEAAPGSIRGDFALEVGKNMVHGSDSDESAEREANLFFPELVLASSRSPQRKAILEQLGIAFDVVVPDVEELGEGDPVEVARENARAQGATPVERRRRVIGVDTLVDARRRIYGKPRDEAHAREMLAALSGRDAPRRQRPRAAARAGDRGRRRRRPT